MRTSAPSAAQSADRRCLARHGGKVPRRGFFVLKEPDRGRGHFRDCAGRHCLRAQDHQASPFGRGLHGPRQLKAEERKEKKEQKKQHRVLGISQRLRGLPGRGGCRRLAGQILTVLFSKRSEPWRTARGGAPTGLRKGSPSTMSRVMREGETASISRQGRPRGATGKAPNPNNPHRKVEPPTKAPKRARKKGTRGQKG